MDDVRDIARRNEWRLDSLDKWRQNVVDPALLGLRADVDGMATKQEIADAVAARVRQDQHVRLSRRQKQLGTVYALLLAALPFVGDLVARVVH